MLMSKPENAAKEIRNEIIESEYTVSHNIDDCVKFVAVNMPKTKNVLK